MIQSRTGEKIKKSDYFQSFCLWWSVYCLLFISCHSIRSCFILSLSVRSHHLTTFHSLCRTDQFISSTDQYISSNNQCISSKNIYIYSKNLYISSKNLYISSKNQCISSKKSIYFLQKSIYFLQKSMYFLKIIYIHFLQKSLYFLKKIYIFPPNINLFPPQINISPPQINVSPPALTDVGAGRAEHTICFTSLSISLMTNSFIVLNRCATARWGSEEKPFGGSLHVFNITVQHILIRIFIKVFTFVLILTLPPATDSENVFSENPELVESSHLVYDPAQTGTWSS